MIAERFAFSDHAARDKFAAHVTANDHIVGNSKVEVCGDVVRVVWTHGEATAWYSTWAVAYLVGAAQVLGGDLAGDGL